MGKIRIHLDYGLTAPIQYFLKPIQIGRAQSHLAGTMKHIHAAGIFNRQLVCDLPGTIGAIVVNH